MIGFFYKDFRNSRFVMMFLAVMQLFVSTVLIFAGFANPDTSIKEMTIISILCYVVIFFLANSVNKETNNWDERQVWQNFASSVPDGIKAQIQSKYLILLLMNLFIYVACMITDAAVVAVSENMGFSMQLPLLFLLCWNLLKDAVAIPFIYACGSSYGMKVKGAFTITLIIIVGVYGLFGDISFFLQDDVVETLKKMIYEGGAVWIVALIPYVTVLCYVLSYRICLKVYRRGIENYE